MINNVDNSWWNIHKMQAERLNREVGTLNDGYNCVKCKNRGYINIPTEVGINQRPCECMQTRRVIRNAHTSGLHDKLKNCTFETFRAKESFQTAIKESAKEFCKDEKARCFYIGGQSGCGKTHICTAIVGFYLKTGKEALYFKWCEEAKRLKSLINDSNYTHEIGKYKTIPVLYIDDFLKVPIGSTNITKPTSADINLALELIDSRLNALNLITIVSSEFTLDDIISLDEATAGRIKEAAGNYTLSINRDPQKNYRLK